MSRGPASGHVGTHQGMGVHLVIEAHIRMSRMPTSGHEGPHHVKGSYIRSVGPTSGQLGSTSGDQGGTHQVQGAQMRRLSGPASCQEV